MNEPEERCRPGLDKQRPASLCKHTTNFSKRFIKIPGRFRDDAIRLEQWPRPCWQQQRVTGGSRRHGILPGPGTQRAAGAKDPHLKIAKTETFQCMQPVAPPAEKFDDSRILGPCRGPQSLQSRNNLRISCSGVSKRSKPLPWILRWRLDFFDGSDPVPRILEEVIMLEYRRDSPQKMSSNGPMAIGSF